MWGDGRARRIFGGLFGACSEGCVGPSTTTGLPSCSQGKALMLISIPEDANPGVGAELPSLEPALGVHQGAQNKEPTLSLPSFKAPKGKLLRNGPNLSPSTAETGPGALWLEADTCSLPPKLQDHNPREYPLPTAGTLQPELKIAILPSEMGQSVNSTSRDTLSSEFKGLVGLLSLLFGHSSENINIFQPGFQHVQLKMAAMLAGTFLRYFIIKFNGKALQSEAPPEMRVCQHIFVPIKASSSMLFSSDRKTI